MTRAAALAGIVMALAVTLVAARHAGAQTPFDYITFDGIEQLHKPGVVGNQRFVVADEVSGAFERPIDLESFRLVSDAFNHSVDSSWNQGGFAEGERVSDLNGSQRNLDRRSNGGIRQE